MFEAEATAYLTKTERLKVMILLIKLEGVGWAA